MHQVHLHKSSTICPLEVICIPEALSEYVIASLFIMTEVLEDPYIMDEEDPGQCHALESSLWEIKVCVFTLKIRVNKLRFRNEYI